MSDTPAYVRHAAAVLATKHQPVALNEYGRCTGAGFRVVEGAGDRARVSHQLPPADLLDPDRPSSEERWEEQRRKVAEYAATLEADGWTVEQKSVLTEPIALAVPPVQRPAVEEIYPGRHRVKGGRNVHATRMVPVNMRGVQTPACGATEKPMVLVERSAAVTCRGCRRVLGLDQ